MSTDVARRIKAFEIAIELLIAMMRTDYKMTGELTCTEGVPPDAVFLYAIEDSLRGSVLLVFEHESFEPVRPGDYIPRGITTHNLHVHFVDATDVNFPAPSRPGAR